MSQELLLTLGHNSSVILVEDGQIINGYEHERITGVKSDSRFPLRTLVELEVSTKHVDNVYITHWDPYASLKDLKAKYWNPDIFDGVPIITHSKCMTHHDTHAWAAMAFAGKDFPLDDTCILVIDGFGSYGEHFSVYQLDGPTSPRLISRKFGYDTSLGLMYQYATAFLGMKMHEDEYKLLGYEVHISELNLSNKQLETINKFASKWVEKWFTTNVSLYDESDPMYSLDALSNIKSHLFAKFADLFSALNILDSSSFQARVVLAYCVQAILEAIVMGVTVALKCKNLIVSGGVFYNVKLNKKLLDIVPGKFCAYPLAGDQGNAIGLYYANNQNFVFPDTICFGRRTLFSPGVVEGLYVVNEAEASQLVPEYIEKYGFVNVVRGNMEFGPRALCHTSTLALPTTEVVKTINEANNRNTVMPMAPVVTREFWHDNFEHCDKIWKSESYMVIAQEYKPGCDIADFIGAAHKYSMPSEHYTGRPQVANEQFVIDVLNHFGGILINTSFNYHGKPIAYDMHSVIENHRLQRLNNKAFHTIVIKD